MLRSLIFIYITFLFSFASFGQSLDEKIGAMIMIGLGDEKNYYPQDSLFAHLKKKQMGGIILFQKDIPQEGNPKSLKKKIDRFQKAYSGKLLVSIDEEGGMVNRLKPKWGYPKTQKAAILGSYLKTDSTSYYAEKTAKTLQKIGVNVNFAPVVDLNINTENPVIAKYGRSFHADPETVIQHAEAVIQAHQKYKVHPVLKHFPGHGSSSKDTHIDLTDVSTSWQWKELLPYAFLLPKYPRAGVMSAHITHAGMDTTYLPATLSRPIITGILRGVLQYNGVIFSDDMQMGAIKNHFGTEKAIEMAISAGVDILVFSNNGYPEDIITASSIHSMIKKMVLEGKISEERIDASWKRIKKFR